MSAIGCEIEIRKDATPVIFPEYYSRVGTPAQQRHCPFCESIIYSRRHKLCGVCAQELPEEFLFNPEQAQNVALLVREEQQRHRAWMQRFSFAG